MTTANQTEFHEHPEQVLDLASAGEPVMIPRAPGRNVVVISESAYRDLQKAKRNIEYLDMLAESEQQYREGRVIVKTMAELEAMADG